MTLAHPLVRFLKQHDVRLQGVDDSKCAFGAAFLVKPARLANVITCNTDVSVCHDTYIGTDRLSFNIGECGG